MSCKQVPWLVLLLLAAVSLAWPQRSPLFALQAFGNPGGVAKPFSALGVATLGAAPVFASQRLGAAQLSNPGVPLDSAPFGQPQPEAKPAVSETSETEPASTARTAAVESTRTRPSRFIAVQESPEPVGGVLGSRQLYAVAQASFFSAAAFDLGLTAFGLHHPRILQLTVTGNGPPTQVDIDESSRFAEAGWARVFGAHNTPAILAAYAAEDTAVFYVVHSFVTHHPRWRMLGTMALLAQTWVHMQAGHTWIGLGQRIESPYAQFNPVWVRR